MHPKDPSPRPAARPAPSLGAALLLAALSRVFAQDCRLPEKWTNLGAHAASDLAPRTPPLGTGAFDPAELTRLARGYYAIFYAAYDRSGRQGFIRWPDSRAGSAHFSEPSLVDRSHKLAALAVSNQAPHHQSLAEIERQWLANGWLVHWNTLRLERRGASGPTAQSGVISFQCGRVIPSPVQPDLRLGDILPGRQALGFETWLVTEEIIPPFVRVIEAACPELDLDRDYRWAGRADPGRESLRSGWRTSRWDAYGELALATRGPGKATLVLSAPGVACLAHRLQIRADRLRAIWLQVLAAEVEAEAACERVLPLLVAERRVGTGPSTGPAFATALNEAQRLLALPDDKSPKDVTEARAQVEEAIRLAMLLAALRAVPPEAESARACAAILSDRLTPGGAGRRALIEALRIHHPRTPGEATGWALEMRAMPDADAWRGFETLRRDLEARVVGRFRDMGIHRGIAAGL